MNRKFIKILSFVLTVLLIVVSVVTLYKLQIVEGKAYYEEHRGTADGLFAQLCEEVDAVNARIKDMQDEMDALKGTFKPDEAPDFESVVSADEENDIEVEIVEEPDEENK